MPVDEFDGSGFTAEDVTLISDLLTGKSVTASTMKNVHENAYHEFVDSFNPNSDDVDKILFQQITKQQPSTSTTSIQSPKKGSGSAERLL